MLEQKRFNRRHFLMLTGMTASAMAVAACAVPGAPAPAGGGAEAPAADGLTLRYRSWHSPAASQGDTAWYDWLSENYTDATIEYEFVPFGAEYIQKVLADSAAGTPPDLLHSSIIWAREFYDRGVLLDLDDYISTVPELAPDQFYGEATNTYRSKDGKFYGVPWEGPDSSIIAVNSNLLAEAGYDPQGADIQTWDDFVEAAKALTKYEGDEVTQAGYLVQSYRSIETFNSWLVSNGGTMHDEAFSAATFNTEAGLAVMEMQLALLNEHKVSFPISPDRQDTQLFVQGKAAMVHAGTWSTTTFDDQKPEGFEYWYMIFPQGPQGQGKAGTTWSNMFVLPKATANSDAAWALMKYCTTPPVVITRFELSTRTTPHKSIFDTEKWTEVLQRAPQRAVTTSAAEAGGVYPFFPFFTEANDAIGIELEQVMTAGKDPQEAINEAERKVNEVIARRTNA
ncbi:MAG: extracellular solute-binding protein [Caldilineaceae bacterium]|nr:extracellular solute-binding protein [Caldilineaceae bacterium]